MSKKKLVKFADLNTFDHVIQLSYSTLISEGFALKGNWRGNFFKNDNPIVLELGCGKGEYTVGLARLFPNKNFIGVDIKGSRMWSGAKEVHLEELQHGIVGRMHHENDAWILTPLALVHRHRIRQRQLVRIAKIV